MRLKVAIVKGVIPSYREGFYDRLFIRDDLSVTVFCQSHIATLNLKCIHQKYQDNVQLVKFLSVGNEKISWQFIPWGKVLNHYDVVVVEGNPRNFTHFILATLLKLKRKKIILWTMAHSMRSNPLTENLRLKWSRLFDFLFVYNDAEVAFLRKKGFRDQAIIGMNNGLDQRKIDSAILKWPQEKLKRWQQEQHLNNKILLLSCSRLDQKNKYHQVVEALPSIIDEFPTVLWCVIGDGTERNALIDSINSKNLQGHIRFLGELYEEEKLTPWFLSSQVLIHPAGIGLSILHAFGYGLPVITHGQAEFHNPEYSAFIDGATGLNFIKDDIQDLGIKVIRLLKEGELRQKMKSNVQRIAREEFNVDVMVERFEQIVRLAAARND